MMKTAENTQPSMSPPDPPWYSKVTPVIGGLVALVVWHRVGGVPGIVVGVLAGGFLSL